jgi:CheY-like chemotaxis protein
MVRGSGTILLVDDEDMVIDVGQALLERLGYQVIAAKSGEEAAEVVLRKGSGIDLVILDMIMPGMDGGKTFDRIRDLHPQMPVLLSSGYAANGQAAEILRKGCNGFIQKPFNIATLSQKIRNILEASKEGRQR